MKNIFLSLCALVFAATLWGCTVKAVGDPNRPITINAHITVDINGLKNTATNIEDFVSGKNEQVPVKK
ncbi:MAG: hypothetical protein HQL25_04440 [Candidatus Omnitrophica bacterium]|nr:hypothetical protein [Candidatus Omnitrophota bacterium]